MTKYHPKLRELASIIYSDGFGWWEERHLADARYISSYSQDPSTKVGAVITEPYNDWGGGKFIVSRGYNGFPQKIRDDEERLNNRELKYKYTIHGEMNALHFARPNLTGCSLYTWPFQPCDKCAPHIIQRGIDKVYAPYSDEERWLDSFISAAEMFKEARVLLILSGKDYSNA